MSKVRHKPPLNKGRASLSQADVTALVVSSLRDVLDQKQVRLREPLSESTALLGYQAVLDSLGLVTVLAEIEQRLETEHGLPLILADDRAVSQRHSPFRTVRSLVEYLCALMEENASPLTT